MAPRTERPDLAERARGCMLGLMVGDALGAAVEGFPPEVVREIAQEAWGTDIVQGFVPAVPMGTFVPGSEPATYKVTGLFDNASNFVPTGPSKNAALMAQCGRCGMYTDDTNACLAVASSLVACSRADAAHAARAAAEFSRDNPHYRGVPPSAKGVMRATLAGVPVEETGLPPHFPFPGGSFANGGAMRISPVGVAYRHADAATLRGAVEEVVRASHRHPEAVDFAVVQAAAVQHALGLASPEDFEAEALLADLAGRCETDAMRDALLATAAALRERGGGPAGPGDFAGDYEALRELVEGVKRPGSGMGFQIASVHMAPCVLWVACRYGRRDPRLALQAAVALGGDTDTTASMVGAIVGALHGEACWGEWAAGLETGEWGRDYVLGLAEKLAACDCAAYGQASD